MGSDSELLEAERRIFVCIQRRGAVEKFLGWLSIHFLREREVEKLAGLSRKFFYRTNHVCAAGLAQVGNVAVQIGSDHLVPQMFLDSGPDRSPPLPLHPESDKT